MSSGETGGVAQERAAKVAVDGANGRSARTASVRKLPATVVAPKRRGVGRSAMHAKAMKAATKGVKAAWTR